MCGFVTIINNRNKDLKNIKELINENKHRGPDEISFFQNKNYSLIFRRLKIIDLSTRGNQPFINNERNIKLVFNGEIYNYLELKSELEQKGVKFKSTSDTEVLLQSFIKWGVNFTKKIRGMFSVVIFDDKYDKIYLFRDHLGQKPLFYSKDKDNLIISSEIKDILKLKKKYTENKKSLSKYLIRGWCDDSKETFFKNIYSLPAASFAIYENNNLTIKKYWKLNIKQNKKYDPEEFKEKFNSNLKLHLRSDVSIAFTLSGGMDSSSLVKTSLDLNLKNYKTYSIKSSAINEDDERQHIDEFVNKNNLNHEYFDVDNISTKNLLEKFIQCQDEPVSQPSFIYQYLLRKKIRDDGFKVLLVGEGGDEILGGYNRMFVPYLIDTYLKGKKNIPDIVKKNIQINTGENYEKFYKRVIKYYKDYKNIKNDIENKNVFDFLNFNENEIKDSLCYYNDTNPKTNNYYKSFLHNHLFKRDLPHILRQEDRVSMSQSIENRSPFVDYTMIEYVFSLKSKYFMKDGNSKFMLKDIMKDELPKNHLNKKKVGRPGSGQNIIFNLYKEKIKDLLNSNKFQNEYFDNKKILEKLSLKEENNNYDNEIYFRILNFLIWKENLDQYN